MHKIRSVAPFITSVVLSGITAALFSKPFFVFVNGFVEPVSSSAEIFDLPYVFFLALFLSFCFDWKETLRQWVYGYLLLIGVSTILLSVNILELPIWLTPFDINPFIPSLLRLLFVLFSASIGFLIGQGLRYLGVRISLKQ